MKVVEVWAAKLWLMGLGCLHQSGRRVCQQLLAPRRIMAGFMPIGIGMVGIPPFPPGIICPRRLDVAAQSKAAVLSMSDVFDDRTKTISCSFRESTSTWHMSLYHMFMYMCIDIVGAWVAKTGKRIAFPSIQSIHPLLETAPLVNKSTPPSCHLYPSSPSLANQTFKFCNWAPEVVPALQISSVSMSHWWGVDK